MERKEIISQACGILIRPSNTSILSKNTKKNYKPKKTDVPLEFFASWQDN